MDGSGLFADVGQQVIKEELAGEALLGENSNEEIREREVAFVESGMYVLDLRGSDHTECIQYSGTGARRVRGIPPVALIT